VVAYKTDVAKHAGLPITNIKINKNSSSHDNIFSAIIHKLNISGHMLIWTFILVLVRGTRAGSSSAPFSYILYIHCLDLPLFPSARDYFCVGSNMILNLTKPM
jgi:hypothetical protein